MAVRYGSFCPVAKAAEVITGRWTPLILYELMRGSERFGEIQNGVPLMPRSLLARRLRELELDGIIYRISQPGLRGHIYRLTPAGESLRPLIDQLGAWGNEWRVPHIDDNDRNVAHLMWSMRVLFGVPTPGGRDFVIHFDFSNVPRRDHKIRQWWYILRDGTVDFCYTDMGFDPDVTVRADLLEFFRVVHGHGSLQKARREGHIAFEGDPRAVAFFLECLDVSEPPVPRFIRITTPPPPPPSRVLRMKSQAA